MTQFFMRGIHFHIGESLFHGTEGKRITHALGAFRQRSAAEQVKDFRMNQIRNLLCGNEIQNLPVVQLFRSQERHIARDRREL